VIYRQGGAFCLVGDANRLSLLLGRKIESSGIVFEMPLVGAVAERFVLAPAAAAQANYLAAAKAIRLAITVYNLEISFNL
jgi:hypothetical protein